MYYGHSTSALTQNGHSLPPPRLAPFGTDGQPRQQLLSIANGPPTGLTHQHPRRSTSLVRSVARVTVRQQSDGRLAPAGEPTKKRHCARGRRARHSRRGTAFLLDGTAQTQGQPMSNDTPRQRRCIKGAQRSCVRIKYAERDRGVGCAGSR